METALRRRVAGRGRGRQRGRRCGWRTGLCHLACVEDGRRKWRRRAGQRDEEEVQVSDQDVEDIQQRDYGSSAGPSSKEEEEDLAESLASSLANVVANPSTYLVAGLVVAGLASQFKPNTAQVVLLSALPVVGLTAISKTEVGESIANKVEEEKKDLLPLANRDESERVRIRDTEPRLKGYFGSGRALLLKPGADHLTGTLPGDSGFDPLGLSREDRGGPGDSEWRNGAYAGSRLGKFFEAELLHARWAMLGAVGCLIPEALARYFGFDSIAEPVWWRVGYSVLHDGVDINYAGLQGFRIAGDKGVFAIGLCQLVLMGGPEYARRVGIESLEPVGIFLPGCINYPGGQLFDPLGLSEEPAEFLEQQVKEIKNGRLAMLSMLGYAAQALVTGKGPLENLDDFIADPAHENIVANLLF
ncbi:chlorophyll a-b binding protein [Chloropicon primus]|uniref:Chlorophyll a-b binding protein, chloroplastic n=1 Tax=Chloropicon primus TaxID=1764295 RepID=A0A5B8MNS5_9CHLO|nr:chlorophyll a-b binding protein [Chloropicon primus]UPR01534.1 chlorophyll a-b binding protein [Chloropicon primus]|eukprot:QDZ22318.1 chlorophyll a-b binding protein [Chloropicon primus]